MPDSFLRRCVLIALLIQTFFFVKGQTGPERLTQANLEEKLSLLTEAYAEVYGFSGHVEVVMADRTVFKQSYGLANRSFNLKNDSTTRFSINSISKTFTATAVLILAQRERLDLSAPISRYLSDLESSWKDSVTVHHLLSHTSGLPRESGVQSHDELTFSEQVDLVEGQPLLFTPGEHYGYSNAGVILLGALIEAVSGMKYAEFIEAEIIRPLKLEDTGYYHGREVVKNQAVPYRFTAGGLEFAQRSKHYGDNAGGGLYSTTSDLYRFVRALEENKILTQAMAELMFTDHIGSGENDYEGYCWSIKYFGDEKIHFAAGSGYGTKSVIIRSPETGMYIGITSNWGNTPILQLLGDLYLTLKGKNVEPPRGDELADPEDFRDKLGLYLFDREELTRHLGMDRSQIRLHEFEGRLFLDDELLAADDGALKLTYTDELRIRFEPNLMLISINGNNLEGRKKQP